MKALFYYFKVNSNEFTFQFQSHPNYPSALAFADTLNFMGLKNDTYELNKEYWNELPEEFITIYDGNFGLIKKEKDNFKLYSDNVKTVSKEELYKNSTNFVMLFEKTEGNKKQNNFLFLWFFYVILVLFLVYSTTFLSWKNTIFNIFSIAGLYVSLEIFNDKFGQGFAVISRICGVSASVSSGKTDCSKMIDSDKINILGLKLADFCLGYFIGILILGLFLPTTNFVLKIFSITSLIIIFYSLYIQVFVEKTICKICLIIISILLLQFTVSFLYFRFSQFTIENISVLSLSMLTFIIIFSILVFINRTLKDNQDLKKSNIKNLRFKRNYNAFKKELLVQSKVIFQKTELFALGKKEAKLHISLISSPFCGFCKDAHIILETILARSSNDISAQIRFNFSENEDENYKSLMQEFVNIYESKAQNEFLKTIAFWYENKDLKKIKEKNNFQNSDIKLQPAIHVGEENKNMLINFTPVFLINGHQFPNNYDREDIFYFIDELLEDEDFV